MQWMDIMDDSYRLRIFLFVSVSRILRVLVTIRKTHSRPKKRQKISTVIADVWQRTGRLFTTVMLCACLLAIAIPAHSATRTYYRAIHEFGYYQGIGDTPELACIDMLNSRELEYDYEYFGDWASYDGIIDVPPVPYDHCTGVVWFSGIACLYSTKPVNGENVGCSHVGKILEEEESWYSIRIEPESGMPESPEILVSTEPGQSSNGLVVRVYDDDGSLVPDVDIRLEVNVKENSGGHQHHSDDRPRGNVGGFNPTPYIITNNTGTDGYKFRFRAPVIAGDHKISATCVSTACVQEGPDEVWVGIKNLVDIENGPHHVLIGTTLSHIDNHYLTKEAKAVLLELAYRYKMLSFPFNPVLHVNDASLERGGVFDLDQNWLSPHHEHRRGTEVDIRANLQVGAIPESDFEEFKELAKELKIDPLFERKWDKLTGAEITGHRHFHLRLKR